MKDAPSWLRTMFESMGEAFYLVELIHEHGQVSDVIYLEENAAGRELVGVSVRGRRLSEVTPDFDREWLLILGRVASTGKSERFQRFSNFANRRLDYHVFSSSTGKGHVGILLRDVSERDEDQQALARELEDAKRLHRLSSLLVGEEGGDRLFGEIVEAAMAIMRADFGSIQLADPERHELRLVAWRNFHPSAAEFWGTVSMESGATCGSALECGERVIVADVRNSSALRNSESQESWRISGIVAVQSTPLVTRDGRIIGMLSTHWRHVHEPGERELRLLDIIARQAADYFERKQTQAALRSSEEQLRLIVESARDYAIFTIDEHNVIDRWLPGAANVFGWSGAEAEGQSGEILYTPEDRATGEPEQEIATARRDGKAPDVRWHQRKDGRRVFIEGQVVPLRDYRNEITGFLKIGQDVTDRKFREDALRESEERFRQFGEFSSDLLWIRDAESLAFEYLSPAFEKLYGVSREEVLARNNVQAWLELIHPEDRDAAVDVLRQTRSGAPTNKEFRIVRPDGEVRWVHNTDFPVLDEFGKVQRIAGIAQDVTGRKKALELQRTLVAELQHRVRNILAITRSIMRRTLAGKSDLNDFAQHLEGRIDALARTQALLTRAPGSAVDLEEIIRDEMLAQATREPKYSLSGPRIRLQPQAAEVLTLAVHELATNSVKYGALANDHGKIRIKWNKERRDGEDWLKLRWSETGIEVPNQNPRQGFGTELITRRVPYELGGCGELYFKSGGVAAAIEFPLKEAESILQPGAALLQEAVE